MSDPARKKSFFSLFDQTQNFSEHKNGHAYQSKPDSSEEQEGEDIFESSYELSDETDHHILMHRDVHFGGDFEVMLSYYNDEEHVGIHPDFDIERIEYLASIESEMGQDLSPLLLTGAEAETVGRARRAYSQLKEIYEIDDDAQEPARLIADLILSEVQEPQKEIEAIVSRGALVVPDLLLLLKADEFYDPLFPGYGYAPYLAIQCLGEIKDTRAIIPIFETLSKPIIFDEMIIVDALMAIGADAKAFLIKVLKSRPLTQDNVNAAFVIISFAQDPEVSAICFEQLQKQEVQEKPLLSTYLLCSCEFLNTSFYREAFIKMAKDAHTPVKLAQEMQLIINEWK